MTAHVLDVMARSSGVKSEDLQEVANKYPVAVPPFLARRIDGGTYSQAALRQYLPDLRELADAAGYVSDPTGETELHPAESVLQAYGDRVALMLTTRCLVYCRFCFRKAIVGSEGHVVSDAALDSALSYVSEHSEITDVLLSGGDPLAVPNRTLVPFLRRLADIPHVRVIRIHSRAVSANPRRINDDLLDCLAGDDRFWYYAHMNHPDDIDHPEVIAAVRRLLSARVPVLNQSVILGGVNDDPETICRLMRMCYENKVIPYNLYVLDRVKGAAHFEVPEERIIEILRSLGELPGPAQPALVYVDQRSRKHRALFSEALDCEGFLGARLAA